MKRVNNASERGRSVVASLVPHYLREGSVAALTGALNAMVTEGVRIHPNRVRLLLAGDPAMSLNPSSMEAIEHAVSRMTPVGSDEVTRLRSALLAKVSKHAESSLVTVEKAAGMMGVPAVALAEPGELAASQVERWPTGVGECLVLVQQSLARSMTEVGHALLADGKGNVRTRDARVQKAIDATRASLESLVAIGKD